MEVVLQGAVKCGYETETAYGGTYLMRVGGDAATGANGWKYCVNGAMPSASAADFAVSPNDGVSWFYGSPSAGCP